MPDGSDPRIPHNPLSISSQNKTLYEQECKHALDLLKRSFNESVEENEIHKRAAFEDVMDRALRILNQAARGLHRNDLMEASQTLQNDLKDYREEGSEQSRLRFMSDLERTNRNL